MRTPRIVSGLIVSLFISTFIGCKGIAYRNVAAGMVPTLNVDDAFTVNPYAYTNHPVERFDIIVFDAPSSTRTAAADARWVKRVVGLPGETIEMRNGKVFVNGRQLEEPFQKIEDEPGTAWKKDFPSTVIPDGQYFVLGDNRPNSEDSRYFDPPTIGMDKIKGKLLDIYPGYYKKS